MFSHEKLDVYRLSLDYAEAAFAAASDLSGALRSTGDQLVRSSQSIPLNIAEGNGKRGGPDRARFFEIARGSAMEAAATTDVLVRVGALDEAAAVEHKRLLYRIVSMLSMAMNQTGSVREDGESYGSGNIDDEYDDDHEYDWD